MENIVLTSIIYCSDLTYSVSVSTISWNMYINFLRWKTNKDEPTISWMALSGVFKSVVFNLSVNESQLTSDKSMSVQFVRFTTKTLFSPDHIGNNLIVSVLSMFSTLWKFLVSEHVQEYTRYGVHWCLISDTRGVILGTATVDSRGEDGTLSATTGEKAEYATYSSTRGFRAGTSSTTGISVWKRNVVDQLRVTHRKKSCLRRIHSNASIP